MRFTLVAAALSLVMTSSAFAHVTLTDTQAPAGSFYKAVLRVPHGCDGSATTAIRVKIPEGVIAVKPMPEPGWKLHVKTGEYDQAYDFYGQTLTHGVVQLAWTNGHLPNDWFNEFAFLAKLPDAPAGTTIYFPVVQVCEQGVTRWITIPAEGSDGHDYDEPAPGVTLTEPSN